MVHVKICGLKSRDDVLGAIDAGADMLGFNFYPPSPRYISPGDCTRLISGLQEKLQDSNVKTVGVFVNLPPEEVRSILDLVQLDLAQLSGDEPPAHLEVLGPDVAIKALRLNGGGSIIHAASQYPKRSSPPSFLVDAAVPGYYGGTGMMADWEAARELSLNYPTLLAGGLNPGNVSSAVRQVKPWGVDVASGVESIQGVKDLAKMRAFVLAARSFEGEEK